MCGIWCSFGFTGITNKQLDIIAHRGPDSQRMDNLKDGLFLGLARLSIIDLHPRADQPLYVHKGNYSIVFNGEIYNYLELREKLLSKGHKFTTTCDTEVLLRSYIEWGKDFLHKLNGMFAFVIYDKLSNILFAARDRFGIKPLYLYQSGENVAIASEIKQFTTLESFRPLANRDMVVDFISWRIRNHTNKTMFNNVFQLRGGQYLEIDLRKQIPSDMMKNVVTWYSYNRLKKIEQNDLDYEGNLMTFRNLLSDSVNLRLRADVEIATCLSGGIDSSSLSCLRNEATGIPQAVFSCCNHEKEFDEYEYAKAVIQKIKTDQTHKIYLEYNNILEEASDFTWYNDEPISSISIIAQRKLFRKIKEEGFKVATGGQGADEILGTYGNTHTFFRELLRNGRLINLFNEINRFSRKNENEKFTDALRNYSGRLIQLFSQNKLYSDVTPDIYSSNNESPKNNPHNYSAYELGLDICNKLNDYNIFLIKFSSLPFLLQYDDRTSMSYSIEERVPYLDHRLVEFVLSVPSSIRIRNGDNKYLLKESIRDLLPKKIYNRHTKLGFGTPQNMWMEGRYRSELLGRVENISNQFPIFNREKVKKITQIKGGFYSSLMWRMIFFDIWAKKFNVTF